MASAVERDDFYGFTVTNVTSEYEPYAERPPFLVEGILHHTMTLLYGEAKTGKSTLAASLAAALANGAPDFLGRKVSGAKRQSVGIIAGDFGDDLAYGDQLSKVLDDDAMVTVYGLDRPPGRKVWEGLQVRSRQREHNLIIVDNLTSFIDGTLSDDCAVNQLYDQLDNFVRYGSAVLAVAHMSEKTGEHGIKPRYPMGSSAIRARARWLWRVEPYRGNVRLSFDGNYAAPHEIVVSPPNGTPRFEVIESFSSDELAQRRERRRGERDDKTRAQRDQYRDFVLAECQGLNQKAVAQKIADEFGKAASTHESQLSRKAYGVERTPDGSWVTLAA